MKIYPVILSLLLALVTPFYGFNQQRMGTLVLIDKFDSSSEMVKSYLVPYLDHFGIVYKIEDIRTKTLSNSADYSLIIIGHDMKHPEIASKLISHIQSKGAGLVSFDPEYESVYSDSLVTADSISSITFNTDHFITSLHELGDTIKCTAPMIYKKVIPGTMNPIVFVDQQPLLLVTSGATSPMVTFTSMEWMKTAYLGSMMGLDDCLWRSFVWAARKPFVMRGLPPLVTMRVDDVAGRGELMKQTPLYWVKTANKYGFKPWLGLFIYNLSPIAVEELRGYLINNQATASPHAFGRPNRNEERNIITKIISWIKTVYNYMVKPCFGIFINNLGLISTEELISYLPINKTKSSTNTAIYHQSYQNNNIQSENNNSSDLVLTDSKFYYYPGALALRVNTYDEFIFFDHHTGKPWSDEEAKRGLNAVDEWYSNNQPLPKSKYFLAHWYEMGSNIIPHISKKWGMEFIGMNKAIDTPYEDKIPWLKGAPFRLYENPDSVTDTTKAVYYADFVDVNGFKFFNSTTEIRDDYGYEWAPDNNTEISANRGIRQLKRALSSMALASLFTHETDYIYQIKPDCWEEQFKIISNGIKNYNPIFLTLDESLKIVRAHKTSYLAEAVSYSKKNRIDISLNGTTDTSSFVYLFTGTNDNISQRLIKIPTFKEYTKISITTESDNP